MRVKLYQIISQVSKSKSSHKSLTEQYMGTEAQSNVCSELFSNVSYSYYHIR